MPAAPRDVFCMQSRRSLGSRSTTLWLFHESRALCYACGIFGRPSGAIGRAFPPRGYIFPHKLIIIFALVRGLCGAAAILEIGAVWVHIPSQVSTSSEVHFLAHWGWNLSRSSIARSTRGATSKAPVTGGSRHLLFLTLTPKSQRSNARAQGSLDRVSSH